MASLNNNNQLTNALMNAVVEAFKSASNDTQDALKTNVWDKIYSKPSSRYYRRTAQFMKSMITPKVKVSGNNIEVQIGIDSGVAQAIYRAGTDEFSAHMNQDGTKAFKQDPYKWNGTYTNEALYIWYDEGTNNSRLPSVDKTNFWYDVMGSRLTDKNPDYDKAYKRFEEELMKNLAMFGDTVVMSRGGK